MFLRLENILGSMFYFSGRFVFFEFWVLVLSVLLYNVCFKFGGYGSFRFDRFRVALWFWVWVFFGLSLVVFRI